MSDLLKKDSNGTAQIAYNGEIIAWNTQALQSAADTLKQIASNFESAHEKCKTLVPKINDAWTSTNGSVAYNDKLNNGLVKHFEEGFEAMTALSRILSEVAETYRTCEQKIANEDYSTNYSGGGNTVNQKYTDGGFKTAGKTTGAVAAKTTDTTDVNAISKSDAFDVAKTKVSTGAKRVTTGTTKKVKKAVGDTTVFTTGSTNEKQVLTGARKAAEPTESTVLLKSVGFDISNTSEFTQAIKNELTKQQDALKGADLVSFSDIASTIDVSAIKAAEILTKGTIPKEGTLCVAENVDGKPFVIRMKLSDGTEHVYPVYIGNSTEMLSAAKTYADSDLEKLEQFKNGTRDLIFNVDSDKTVNLGRATYYDSRNVKLQNGKDYASVLTTPTLRDMAKNVVNNEDVTSKLSANTYMQHLQNNSNVHAQQLVHGALSQLQNGSDVHAQQAQQLAQEALNQLQNGSNAHVQQVVHGALNQLQDASNAHVQQVAHEGTNSHLQSGPQVILNHGLMQGGHTQNIPMHHGLNCRGAESTDVKLSANGLNIKDELALRSGRKPNSSDLRTNYFGTTGTKK